MNKEELRNELNNLEDLKKLYRFVENAEDNNSEITIDVKTTHYSWFFSEYVNRRKKVNINSDLLLEVLYDLIKEKESEIDEYLKDSDNKDE